MTDPVRDASARRAAWLLFAWVALLYATLAQVRPWASWLRSQGWLGITVAVLLLASVALTLLVLRQRGERAAPIPPLALAVSLAAGVLLARIFELPEERIHIASYVVVGVLAWRAWSGRLAPAALTVLAIGVGDEAIQELLPSRVFDWWDIASNAVAGLSALLLAMGGRLAWGAPLLLIAGTALFGLRAPMGPPPPWPPPATPVYPDASVVFVTIDALRADHVPPWGEAPVPTPAFERLARESLRFESAAANAIWTTPSMVSFFSALPPATHGVETRGLELAPAIDTPLERLRDSGWRTLGFAGDASETYRNLGFQAELDRSRSPEEVVTSALLQGQTPVFVWMHLREIHAPYDAAPARLRRLGLPDALPDTPILARARRHPTIPRAKLPGPHSESVEAIRALYAAELVNADTALGRILTGIDAIGFTDRVILVVSADHGEELLEHGGIGHASTTLDSVPHPELVRIPLYVRLPDGRGAGRDVAGRIEQVDLLPTLLARLGVPWGEGGPGAGRDLSRYLPGGADAGRAIPERPLLVSSSPCGWQCPPDRRGERVHAWVGEGEWRICREPAEGVGCPARITDSLRALRARGEQLGRPVASVTP